MNSSTGLNAIVDAQRTLNEESARRASYGLIHRSKLPAAVLPTAEQDHSFRKASVLRAARLESYAKESVPHSALFASMPEAVARAADHVFAEANAVAMNDARFYLWPDTVLIKPRCAEVLVCRARFRRGAARFASRLADMTWTVRYRAPKYNRRAIRSARQRTASKLISLPSELRNEIWKMVLDQDDPIDIGANKEAGKQPALLHVSRQVRVEALAFYYSRNDFLAKVHDANTAYVCKWLEGVGSANGKHIRRVQVLCTGKFEESWLNCGNFAPEHYFTALTRCFRAACVCYDAIEIRTSNGNQFPLMKADWDPVREFYRHDVQCYMKNAEYPWPHLPGACSECRGRNAVWHFRTGCHELGGVPHMHNCQRVLALPERLPPSLGSESYMKHWCSPSLSARGYLDLICGARDSGEVSVRERVHFDFTRMARLLTNSARWTLAGSLISKYRCRLPSATLQSILSDRVKGELKDALALERLENIGEDPKTVKKRRANGEMESEVRVLLTQMLGEENVVSVIDPMLEAMARDE